MKMTTKTKGMSHSSTSGSQSHTRSNKTNARRSFPERQDQNRMGNLQITVMKKVVERLTNAVNWLEQNQVHTSSPNIEVEFSTR